MPETLDTVNIATYVRIVRIRRIELLRCAYDEDEHPSQEVKPDRQPSDMEVRRVLHGTAPLMHTSGS